LKQEISSPRIPGQIIVQKSKFLDKEIYLKRVFRQIFTTIGHFSPNECLPKGESRLKIQPETRVAGSVQKPEQLFVPEAA
jgi:hypothetical protein